MESIISTLKRQALVLEYLVIILIKILQSILFEVSFFRNLIFIKRHGSVWRQVYYTI